MFYDFSMLPNFNSEVVLHDNRPIHQVVKYHYLREQEIKAPNAKESDNRPIHQDVTQHYNEEKETGMILRHCMDRK